MSRQPQVEDGFATAEDPAATIPSGAVTDAAAGAGAAGAEQLGYLLVFDRDSSSMFQLPRSGETTIGRTSECHLQLRDSSVSRVHAQITMLDGRARITDLGSHNGTRVNGEPISGAWPLVSGDTITICSVTLVFNSRTRPTMKRALLEFSELLHRINEEMERASRYSRPLALIAALFGQDLADKRRLAVLASGQLRLIDVIGWGGGDSMFLLLPETDADGAAVVAGRIQGSLKDASSDLRIGYAAFPAHGCDADALVASARRAAMDAEPHEVGSAGSRFDERILGDRKIVVADPAMASLYDLVERIAKTDLPVLVHGETGTGKELVANAIHAWSRRSNGPFVALNCAALPETLIESELFGYEKGSFSGASSAGKLGLLESAHGGTVFLDELGELPLAAQAKLLRVFETRRLVRIGDLKEREIDVRFVAATNRNLTEDARTGRFRQDLFFRLSAATVWIPPLRDRKLELPILARRFLEEASALQERQPLIISDAAMQFLIEYAWPGNVRELRNLINYLVATTREDVLLPHHLVARLGSILGDATAVTRPDMAQPLPDEPKPGAGPHELGAAFRPIDEELREIERTRMAAALRAAGGNRTRAAQLISMPLRTFLAKMKTYGLRTEFERAP